MWQRRDEGFRMMLNVDEKRALQELAERDGGSQAAIVRRLVRAEAEKRGLWPIAQGQPSRVQEAVPA